MEDKIPSTIAKVIDVLAEKFGATGKELWASVTGQQSIEAVFSLGWVMLTLLADVSVMVWWFRWCDGEGFPLLFWTGAFVLANAVAYYEAYDAATCFYNPTYAALTDILGMIKSDTE